ncbi:MAG: hypothetical protein ACXWCG_00615 [Flavitalea sp.]
MRKIKWIGILPILIFFSGCGYFIYLPKTAKQKYFARPHIQFMMAVISFRESTGVWPGSVYQFTNHAERNKKIIDAFQYHSIYFHQKKNDKLIVSFGDYKKEFYLSPGDGQIDLNSLGGIITFYNSNGRFVWKVKM